MSTSSNILTPAHQKSIEESIAKLKSAQKELDMAERAGLTTGPNGQKLADAKTQVKDLLDKLQQIKNVYFPGT